MAFELRPPFFVQHVAMAGERKGAASACRASPRGVLLAQSHQSNIVESVGVYRVGYGLSELAACEGWQDIPAQAQYDCTDLVKSRLTVPLKRDQPSLQVNYMSGRLDSDFNYTYAKALPLHSSERQQKKPSPSRVLPQLDESRKQVTVEDSTCPSEQTQRILQRAAAISQQMQVGGSHLILQQTIIESRLRSMALRSRPLPLLEGKRCGLEKLGSEAQGDKPQTLSLSGLTRSDKAKTKSLRWVPIAQSDANKDNYNLHLPPVKSERCVLSTVAPNLQLSSPPAPLRHMQRRRLLAESSGAERRAVAMCSLCKRHRLLCSCRLEEPTARYAARKRQLRAK